VSEKVNGPRFSIVPFLATALLAAQDAEIAKLRGEIAQRREENEAMASRFRHTHVAGWEDLDTCGECGFDLRHPVHTRLARHALAPEEGG